MNRLDLRSDTVTQPTAGMRAAMANAGVGDDVYGEDPSIIALEQRVAQLLGKESALLCSSGTQSNLCGLLSHCRNGEEYIVGQEYHTYRYEAGGAAVVGGIVPQPLEVQADGTLDLELLVSRIKPDDPHFPITRLLAFENTHAGQAIDPDYFQTARRIADQHSLSMHLDGARLANAAVASNRSMLELAAPFDSVSICCSKGLGAPVGSLLAGSGELIGRARRWRKMLGGGMRQAGIIAAGIDYALTHHYAGLQQDHENAQWLASALKSISNNNNVEVSNAQTNMVYVQFDTADTGRKLQQFMAEQQIIVPAGKKIRLVTHLDVSRQQLEHFAELFAHFLHKFVSKF
ncbi:low-specificity L-threonine aldolase [Idiomarina seosinensis]|uniref:Low-specificity L-threonine aldolase n=2 Tax=Idiomarina seosinensis TaxID=281739 RepID=A0A432ZFE3_9GAMM|nr:low-specificity L-threonine aldolase [Idiomarina seosinensis]RUO76062.1 low-specificity L-threonine aldolase [Idiomarina seosinensis]